MSLVWRFLPVVLEDHVNLADPKNNYFLVTHIWSTHADLESYLTLTEDKYTTLQVYVLRVQVFICCAYLPILYPLLDLIP